MLIPRPGYLPLVVITNDDALTALAGIQSQLSVGVGVFGPAAAYALVWELGSRRLTKPGPRTVWGINRDGERMIMSSQAPYGYVGVNANAAQAIIAEALKDVKFDLKDVDTSKLRLEIALDNAAQKIARIMSDDAPADSGDLRSQIHSIDSDEANFLSTDSDQGTLFI